MPVVCATDVNCDMGEIAVNNGFGVWVPSNDVEAFTKCVHDILSRDIKQMGEKGYEFLKQNYLVEHSYNQIMKHF
jgi:glycosyltransferase involved in cell wall biosynthesis